MTNTESDRIDREIRALVYDPRTVMTFNGTKVENVPPSEGRHDDSTYIVVTREKVTYGADFDVAVPLSYESVTYPGALLVANDALLDGRPSALLADRGELELTINLPGLTEPTFKAVASFGKVKAGITGMLERWFKEYDGHKLPAVFDIRSSIVYDENEMALKFGCDASFVKNKLNLDFSMKRKQKKSVYVAYYKQVFYSVSASQPARPSGVFDQATTWADLSSNISSMHPPLMVADVQYGRQIYVKFESSLTASELELIAKASISPDGGIIDLNGSAEYKSKLSKVSVDVLVAGGSTEIVRDLKLNDVSDLAKIRSFMNQHVDLSRENPGVPLNYRTVFLRDGTAAKTHGSTEYVVEKAESFRSGELEINHTGGYAACFRISWDEINYSPEGVVTVTKNHWTSNDRTAKYQATVPLPANARNISTSIDIMTLLAWDRDDLRRRGWRTSKQFPNRPLVPHRKFSCWGSTIHPSFKEETTV